MKHTGFIEFIKNNYKKILMLVAITVISVMPLPYYIDMPGGLISTNNRVIIDNSKDPEGSFNLTYVSEVQATPILYLLAKLNKRWEINKEEDITLENQSIYELNLFNKLLLESGNSNAILNAYKYANKEYNITKYDITVGYIYPEATTNLKVGDIITKIDDNEVNTLSELKEYINNKNANDKINLTLQSGEIKEATIKEIDKKLAIGIAIIPVKNINTTPKCKLITEDKESGPSGGLMTTLTIYDKLVDIDLTKGYTIAGTGTIEEDGSIGEIGGVKFKLRGAVKKKADIFLVPAGDNYNEAIKEKNKYKYDIEIVSISTFEDALNYLNNLDNKKL